MTTTEHLQLIKTECERLLAIAEKRTQGKWIHREGFRMCLFSDALHQDPVLYGDEYVIDGTDADYIAACAGHAEAGWRSTIAAIDLIFFVQKTYPDLCATIHAADEILAAWPIELLQQ